MPRWTHLIQLRAALVVALTAGIAIAVPAAATDPVVVVQRGDTLSEIALRYGMSVAQLRDLNGIVDPNRIYAGQRLRLSDQLAVAPTPAPAPAQLVHVVASGENLTAIAHRYGSTIAAIAGANAIRNPSFLRVGQRLTIPGTAAPAAPAPAAPAAPAPAAPAGPPPAAPAPAQLVHVVASGETLTAVAHRYGSTVAAIVQANGISNPSFLRVGQQLTIPGTAASTAATTTMPNGLASLVAARGDIGDIIRAEASAQGVPVAFALAVAWQESGWRANVVSRAGAVGVMQLMPATADWVSSSMLGHRVDLYDAHANVQAGVTLLKHYLARYGGDRSLTLAAYYQGQTAADRHGIYRMTRPYIASITALESFFAN